MSGDSRWDDDELSLEALERINRVCLQFEAVWKEGREPKIENYLGATEGEERAGLLRELLLLDLDYRWRFDRPATAEDYGARFPEDRELIEEILGRLSTRTVLHGAGLYRLPKGPLQPGLPSRLGDYELEELLGEGGMGSVYRARQSSVSRTVALKVVRSDRFVGLPSDRLREAIRRFQIEIQAAAKLEHESIVPVYEVGQVEGQPFFSMRYFEGGSLDSVIRQGPLDGREAAALVEKIARAVQHAHSQGVIHRDLKPRNILLDSNGHPYIADFGLAKTKEMQEHLTLSGEVVGTPAYMAPEQARGEASVGMAADIYGLGATLYELVTGRPPFRAATVVETQRQVIDNAPVPPRELNSAIPRDLETICLKCLEKDPRSRYASAEEVAEELARFRQRRPIRARPIGRVQRFWRWCRRNPLDAGLSVTVMISLLVGVMVSGWFAFRARENEQTANANAKMADDLAAEATASQQEATDRLWRSLLSQARTNRLTNRIGQRFDSLRLLQEAAAIRHAPELRDEAIACMALTDLRVIREWSIPGKHTPVYMSLFSPDLSLYTVSDQKGAIRICRATDDREVARFPTSGKANGRQYFQQNGRLLVHWQEVGKFRDYTIWDVESGEAIHKVRTPSDSFGLRVAPNGLFAVSANSRKHLQLRKLPKGEVVFSLDTDSPIEDAICGPFGRHLAVVYQEQTRVDVFSLEDGACKHRIETRFRPESLEWAPRLLKWAPNGRYLALPEDDGANVAILDVQTGKFAATLSHPHRVYGAGWHPNSESVAIACSDCAIYVWNVKTGREQMVLQGHGEAVIHVTFNSVGDMLASWSFDRTTFLWDAIQGSEILRTRALYPRFSVDGRQLITLASGYRLFEVPQPQCKTLRAPPDGRKGPWSVDFSPDLRLVVGASDEGVTFWDWRTRRQLAFLPLPGESRSAFFTADNRELITSGSSGLRCWPLRMSTNGEKLTVGPPVLLGGPIPKVVVTRTMWGQSACTPTGNCLIAISDWNQITVRHRKNPGSQTLLKPHKSVAVVAVSPDGLLVATGDAYPGGIKVWNSATGELVKKFNHPTLALAFSADGKWLAGALGDTYRVWEVGTWEIKYDIPGLVDRRSFAAVGAVAFSPPISESQILALATGDSEIQLRNVASGQRLATLKSNDPIRISALRFSHDGRLLAAAGVNHIVQIWDLARVREELSTMGLDWEMASYPQIKRPTPDSPISVEVHPKEALPFDWPAFKAYRNGNWEAARKAAEESMRQTFGGNGYHWFLMAKVHAQLGNVEEAEQWFHRGCDWVENEMPDDEELRDLQFETACVIMDRQPKGEAAAHEALAVVAENTWTDLLSHLNLEADGVSGKWSRSENGITVAPQRDAIAPLPALVQGSYELEVEVTRQSGKESVMLHLPVGLCRCNLIVGGFPTGKVSGLARIERRGANSNSSTRISDAFVTGRRHTVLVRVRVESEIAAIEVLLDGKSHLSWAGNPSTLRCKPEWDLPELGRPGLGAYNVPVTFHSVKIRSISGNDTIELSEQPPYPNIVLTARCGGSRGNAFKTIVPPRTTISGFRLRASDRIRSIQPLCMTPDGLIASERYGRGAPTHEVIARPGYAVSGLTVRGEKQVDGIRVTFSRIDRNRLNLNDSYESEWFGSDAGKEQRISGDGDPIVGIHGMDDGSLGGIGLVVARMSKPSTDPMEVNLNPTGNAFGDAVKELINGSENDSLHSR